MDLLRITGGGPLTGEVAISGSKNAALPVMAASLLTDEPLELENVPEIEDIGTMAAMLRHLGVEVERLGASRWRLDAARVQPAQVGAELTQRMRGSFLLLGALVGRTGEAEIAKPGGDDIGMRRVEQHLEGLRLMGAEVAETATSFVARARRLRGAHIYLDMPTVTGTENLMMAAVLADGITVISNAAREPHIYDLARCLVGMGARISGVGTELIVVEGQSALLHGTRHQVTTDYVEAGTYMTAAAATGGSVVVDGMRPSDLRPLINKLQAAGSTRGRGGSPRAGDRRPAPGGRRHHLAAPRFRHRPPASVRGSDDPGEGHQHHQRGAVREPLPPRRRAGQDGCPDHGRGPERHHHRPHPASRRRGLGARHPERCRAGHRRALRRRAPPSWRTSSTSTAVTRAWRPSCGRWARRWSGCVPIPARPRPATSPV